MLSIFNHKIKANFWGVRWNLKNGKILSKTETWDELPEEAQMNAIALAPWDFFRWQSRVFVKHITYQNEEIEEFFLLPADEWENTIEKLEAATQELKQTKDQLMGFVQNVPIPLLVFSNNNQEKVLFANQLLLQLTHTPLAKLYQGLTIQDLFPFQTTKIQALCQECATKKQPVQEIIEITTPNHEKKYWLLRIFPIRTTFLEGFILGIIDMTQEKEQEIKLQEAYQELQTQAEELTQSQEALTIINEELKKSFEVIDEKNKELEDSLKAARRFQRKLLINLKDFEKLKEHYSADIKILPHSIIGGDFFIVDTINNKFVDWYVFIFGDATGHGPTGTLLALTVKLLLKNELNGLEDLNLLHTVLQNTHQEMLHVMEAQEQLASVEGAEVAILALPKNPSENPFCFFSSAGIPLYYFQYNSKEWKIINHKTKGLGWTLKDATLPPFQTNCIQFSKKDTCFLFTDGLQDQLSPEYKKIGKKLLVEQLKSLPYEMQPSQKLDTLEQFWKQWKGNQTQTDDILMACLTF